MSGIPKKSYNVTFEMPFWEHEYRCRFCPFVRTDMNVAHENYCYITRRYAYKNDFSGMQKNCPLVEAEVTDGQKTT